MVKLLVMMKTGFNHSQNELRPVFLPLGSPTPDTAAWGPPLMYQYGETVITTGRGCPMSSLTATLVSAKKIVLDTER
jgi:hypothetical protein